MSPVPANLAVVRDEVERRWQLTVGPVVEPGGLCSWVALARTADGQDVVLKIGWPHPEAQDEAAGLTFWNGDGVVRLLATTVIAGTTALLLEQCVPGTSLTALASPAEQDEVVAAILRKAWRAPAGGHQFRPLQHMCDMWADGAGRRLAAANTTGVGPASVDHAMVSAGIEAFRSLPGTSSDTVVLFTDLHAGNVLAAHREPWLAIDPKPYAGDPTYDVLQHMLNSSLLLSDPMAMVTRMAGLLDLDRQRLREWTFARCAIEAPVDPDLAAVASELAL